MVIVKMAVLRGKHFLLLLLINESFWDLGFLNLWVEFFDDFFVAYILDNLKNQAPYFNGKHKAD